ncbi:PREDICTED: LOW QUALITY PROTEIN: beta-galactosidase 2 [Camelina sativa]|uniref:LOW QUALITY PROTEIN: beta-galactosidase 2 n=1 Tax=Camelina sativa TaxID=90675 RepID=A0ABM0ZHG2_CAMSA|nr:PREDICTED: LOW QUALITY PROTEIN: beta-galactosidase 2 [Camelina sativa]
MDNSHNRRRGHGFVLLLVLIYSSVFGFSSKIDISRNARGIKIVGDQKRFLSDSNHYHRSDFVRSLQHGKEHSACTNHKSVRGPITRLYCQDGYIITKINFADYFNPTGACKHFRHGSCGAPATLRLVKKNCLGKPKCVFLVTDEMFGPSHCKGPPTLAVDATCTKS